MFKVKYRHILSRFDTCLDMRASNMGYSAEIWALGHPILFSFTVVPIIFVERTSIFLKSGIWVTQDYIITLY